MTTAEAPSGRAVSHSNLKEIKHCFPAEHRELSSAVIILSTFFIVCLDVFEHQMVMDSDRMLCVMAV